jgi:hypothetical protein
MGDNFMFWENLGGTAYRNPSVVSRAATSLDLFIVEQESFHVLSRTGWGPLWTLAWKNLGNPGLPVQPLHSPVTIARLCRILDMLHMGYVDEVLFGYEVVERLPSIVKEWRARVKARPK